MLDRQIASLSAADDDSGKTQHQSGNCRFLAKKPIFLDVDGGGVSWFSRGNLKQKQEEKDES